MAKVLCFYRSCSVSVTSEAKRRITTIFVIVVYSTSLPDESHSVRCLSSRTAVAYGAHVGSAVLYVTRPIHDGQILSLNTVYYAAAPVTSYSLEAITLLTTAQYWAPS